MNNDDNSIDEKNNPDYFYDGQFNIDEIEENNYSKKSLSLLEQNNQNIPNIRHIFNKYNNNNIRGEGPINLIKFNKNNFELNKAALDILRSIKDQIIVVSIVGKARTGKSYLMNLLLNTNNNINKNKGFKVASSINSCTRGIWLWSTPRQKPNSSAKIIFIDSEGTNSVDISTKTYDTKIFALIILLSSLFIYNTNGNIDETSISELALSTYLSNSIAINTNKYTNLDIKNKITNIDKDKIISDLAPKFIWTLRDFTLDKIDPDTGEEITSDEYLELCLRNKSAGKNSNENNIIRQNIIKYFKERECVTLPRPVDNEEDLQRLDDIPFNELKSNFRTEFLLLKKKVYETSKPKIFNGKKITGPILADLLIIFINSINSGIIPNIDTAWDNIIINEIQTSYEKCKNNWKQNTENNIANINIKLIYDLKYLNLTEFNQVIEENGEIRHNKNYFNKFKEYKNKLNAEIQKDIDKFIKQGNKQNLSQFQKIINNHKQVFDQNLSNNTHGNKFEELIIEHNGLLNNIKNSNIIYEDNKDTLNLLCKSDLNYTKDMVSYISNNLKQKMLKQKLNIEKEIKNNEVKVISDENALRTKKINKDLDNKYNNLLVELDEKNKELIQLIGKYTILMERRDELFKEKKSLNLTGLRNVTLRNSKKSSISQLYYDSESKVCGCQLDDNLCFIF